MTSSNETPNPSTAVQAGGVLLPCPFCGKKPQTMIECVGDEPMFARCRYCGVGWMSIEDFLGTNARPSLKATNLPHGIKVNKGNKPMSEKYEIEKLAFESKAPDRGYTVKASYLKEPHKGDALIEIFKDGQPLRSFIFPAYKVWNIAAHFSDIVDGEIENSARGYQMAAWNGIEGAIFFDPK